MSFVVRYCAPNAFWRAVVVRGVDSQYEAIGTVIRRFSLPGLQTQFRVEQASDEPLFGAEEIAA